MYFQIPCWHGERPLLMSLVHSYFLSATQVGYGEMTELGKIGNPELQRARGRPGEERKLAGKRVPLAKRRPFSPVSSRAPKKSEDWSE